MLEKEKRFFNLRYSFYFLREKKIFSIKCYLLEFYYNIGYSNVQPAEATQLRDRDRRRELIFFEQVP